MKRSALTSVVVRISSVLLAAVIVVIATRLVPYSLVRSRLISDGIVAATLLETEAGTTLLNYQGRLASPATGAPLADGSYAIVFAIFDASSAGNQLWSEARTVQTQRGLFVALLGEVTPLPLGIFDGRDLWLQVQVNGESLSSRQRMAWVPYAINARKAETVVENTIASSSIADGSVTSADLADGTVTAADLADGSGSGVDADLLDGRDSTTFAAASHTHGALPIAYGTVSSAGAPLSGTPNFTVVWNSTQLWYEIVISGESYFYPNYATLVTVLQGGSCATVNPTVGSANGTTMLVVLTNNADVRVQCGFQFVTFKP